MSEQLQLPVRHQRPYNLEATDHQPNHTLQTLTDNMQLRRFARPALWAALGAPETARFLDDFLWNFIGDPVRIGSAMPKKPGWGDDTGEYAYDYNQTLVNGYTDKGLLLNIRTTPDPAARPLERHLVVVGDMANLRVDRYRVNEIEFSPRPLYDGGAMKLIVTTDRFDVLDGAPHLKANPLADDLLQFDHALMQQDDRHDQQATIELSHQSVSYKPLDGHKQAVRDIDRVVRDRHIVTSLAIAAGIRRSDNSDLQIPPSYLSERVAS